MTIHVSLPKELEGMVHAHVDSGMYQTASEVVREALRRFFNSSDRLSVPEIAYIREIISPRLEEVRNGTAQLLDGTEVFAEMDKLLEE